MELLQTKINGITYIVTIDNFFIHSNEFSLFQIEQSDSLELLHCVPFEKISEYMSKYISGTSQDNSNDNCWVKIRDY